MVDRREKFLFRELSSGKEPVVVFLSCSPLAVFFSPSSIFSFLFPVDFSS